MSYSKATRFIKPFDGNASLQTTCRYLSWHPPMWFSVVFTRVCPRLWLLRANSRRQAKEGVNFCACRHSFADAPLPGGASTRGCVSSGAVLLSRDGGEESSPAPSERNAHNEHDRKPHLHRMPRKCSATGKQDCQTNQISTPTTRVCGVRDISSEPIPASLKWRPIFYRKGRTRHSSIVDEYHTCDREDELAQLVPLDHAVKSGVSTT